MGQRGSAKSTDGTERNAQSMMGQRGSAQSMDGTEREYVLPSK